MRWEKEQHLSPDEMNLSPEIVMKSPVFALD